MPEFKGALMIECSNITEEGGTMHNNYCVDKVVDKTEIENGFVKIVYHKIMQWRLRVG